MVDRSTIAKLRLVQTWTSTVSVMLALLACWPSCAVAEWPRAYLNDSDLNRVAFSDTQNGWAVGDRGLILRTTDGGQTWHDQRTGVDGRLTGLAVLDHNRAWVSGSHVSPYTHVGAGFLLTTDDGGTQWEPMPRAAFSFLHDLAMSGDRIAIAVGSPWPLFPSGLFRTSDAGRTWQPFAMDTDNDWVACQFNSNRRALLVGRHRASAVANPDQLQHGIVTSKVPSALHCGCWLDDDTALVAGDDGTLLMLLDDRWIDARHGLPPATRDHSWRTIAAHGEHVWLAGAPGNIVLHSPNRGRHWQALPAGDAVPIHDLTFVDEQHGFAVGALGQIRATFDGGRTWKTQRGEGRRLAALVIGTSLDELPWLVTAHVSGEHRGRSQAILLTGPHEFESDFRVTLSERAHSAALSTGANGAEVWQDFPNAPPVVRANRHAVEVGWILHQRSVSNVPNAMARLTDRLAVAIRQWRPELLVIQSEDQRSALSGLVIEAANSAVVNASRPDVSPIGPAAWRVRHILKVSHDQPPRDTKAARLAPSRMSAPLGESLGELVAKAESQFGFPVRSTRPIYVSNVIDSPVRKDLNSYVVSATDTQREVYDHAASIEHPFGFIDNRTNQSVTNLQRFTKQAQQQEHTRALLERNLTPAEIARSLPLLNDLQPDSATRLMLKLAADLASSGEFAAANQLRMSLRSRYPGHPAADAALWQLFRNSVSEEAQLRSRKLATVSGIAKAPEDNGDSTDAFPVAAVAEANEPEFVVQTSHAMTSASQSVAPSEWYEQSAATLRGRPAWQFAMISTRPSDQSLALLNRLKRSAPSTAWRLSAASEIWLNDRARNAPKPVWKCGFGDRPHLDGKLDDTLWANITPQSLASLQPLDHPLETKVWVARDKEHLYMAVQCERLNEMTYPESDRSARPRDTLPSGLDRVDFFLDVNRDYTSGWQLGFDSRGWAMDAESKDVQWNPKWHVASHANEKHWFVEAAIPLAELVLDPQSIKPAWLMSVRRVCPGWGWQSWPASMGASPSWPKAGLLLTGNQTAN